jgi:hypothetical protein
MTTYQDLQQYLLGPLVSSWYSRFEAAEKHKDRFKVMAKLCRQFLGSSAKAMWENDFRAEFYPRVNSPEFMVSLNKAFELVAIIGPSLYWQNPTREVKRPSVPDQASILQSLGMGDETLLQMIRQEQQVQESRNQLRSQLASSYLEYSTREQPNGLKADMEQIIQEAQVTGLGLGWTEAYTNRVTGAVLTGTFFDSVDNLLLDPDSRDPNWKDVKWMARRHCEPIWEVERRFGYEPGYLRGKGTSISAEHQSHMTGLNSGQELYHDMMEWYEIWSCAGIGARVTQVHADLGHALDRITGDYCYLCITKNVPHPLNLPAELLTIAQPEMIQDALRWRAPKYGPVFELWQDRKWPVEPMKFYSVPNSPWPMAVLGPGIGCLLAMNILLVTHLGMSWDRRRDFIAANEAYAAQVEAAVKGENNPAVIKINSASEMPVSDVIAFVNRPDVQGNLLEWLEWLDNQFQMATGLGDIHYGISQRQVRVSSDIEARRSAANVRPEKMATDVHQFVVATSTKEMWLAALTVRGAQLSGLLGPWGGMAWDTLVAAEDIVSLSAETEIYVEASDLRRPNREKDMADLERLLPFWLPVLQNYMPATTDTNPANAMGMREYESLFLGQWTPPAPDPQMAEMQQAQFQAEIENTVAQTEETRAKTAARLIDAQYKQSGAAAPARQKLQWAELMHRQKMRMQEEAHLQDMVHRADEQAIKQAEAKRGTNSK